MRGPEGAGRACEFPALKMRDGAVRSVPCRFPNGQSLLPRDILSKRCLPSDVIHAPDVINAKSGLYEMQAQTNGGRVRRKAGKWHRFCPAPLMPGRSGPMN